MTGSWKLLRRLAITVVGLVVLLLGVVLIVAPGPGFLVIALGLLILSLEYEWARRHLDRVKSRARTVADQAAANKVSTSLSVLFALGVIGLGGVLTLTQTLPGSGLATGASLVFGGIITLSTIIYSVVQRRRSEASVRADAEAGEQ